MAKKLVSLEEFDKRKFEEYNKKPKGNGIACPKCSEELIDIDSSVLLSSPPRVRIKCGNCDYKGTRIK